MENKIHENCFDIFSIINNSLNISNLRKENFFNFKGIDILKENREDVLLLIPDIFIKENAFYHILIGDMYLNDIKVINIGKLTKGYKKFSSTSLLHTYFMKDFIYSRNTGVTLERYMNPIIISTFDKVDMLKYLKTTSSDSAKYITNLIEDSKKYYCFMDLFRGWYFKNKYKGEYNNIIEFFNYLIAKSNSGYVPRKSFRIRNVYEIVWDIVSNLDSIDKFNLYDFTKICDGKPYIDIFDKYYMIVNALVLFFYLKGNKAE